MEHVLQGRSRILFMSVTIKRFVPSLHPTELVVLKSDPYMLRRELIVVPINVLHGLITTLHLYFNHAIVLQLTKIFNRYFFALSIQQSVKAVVESCSQRGSQCTSLKAVSRRRSSPNLRPRCLFHQASCLLRI